jgi:hypothetical protein
MTEGYEPATVVEAEGARVALLSCRICGAVVMADPRDTDSKPDLHRRWHTESADAE